jgi:hypothetical protein
MLASYLVAFALAIGDGPAHRDACASALPADLRAAALREFPGSDLPRQSDNLPDDIKYNRDHGGNGCLGVAKGSFTGRGKKDLAFLLTEKDKVWLVIATSHGVAWNFEKVWEAGPSDYRLRLYVDVASPGKFDDCCLDAEPGPGQVVTFTSDHEVVVTGATESTGIAFFKTPKGWVHVWISD